MRIYQGWRLSAGLAAIVASIIASSTIEQGPAAADAADAWPTQAALPTSPQPSAHHGLLDRQAWISAHIDARIAATPSLAQARIAVFVQRLADGAILYQRDGAAPYNLASNTKLVTAITALTVLGPSYRFTTSVYAKGYDAAAGTIDTLYLRGGGDPTLGEDDLHALAKALAARGVRTVRQVVWDDTMFDDVNDPPRFGDAANERAAFRASTSALSIEGNVVRVDAIAGKGAQATIEVHPATLGAIRLKSAAVEVGDDRRSAVMMWARPQPPGAAGNALTEIEVRGSMARSDGMISQRRRLEAPARVAAECFVYYLRRQGIKAPRPDGRRVTPPALTLLVAHTSAPLAQILAAVGKHSNNFVAEMIFKATGAVGSGVTNATWAEAQRVVINMLASLGIDTSSVRLENGSGLYDASSMSAMQLVTVISAGMRSWRLQPEFIASLAIGGQDGTLASRFHDNAARGFVRAKTGTLDQVSTLAGIIGTSTLDPIAFAILINDMPVAAKGDARQLQDDIVSALFLTLP